MSTATVPPSSTFANFPFSIYTIRRSRDLAADYQSGGAGEFTENQRWVSALGFLASARKNGQRVPIIFAASESINGIIYFAYIDDLSVSPLDEHGKGTTTIRFSALQRIRPKRPLSSLRLKSSGKPLSDKFIKPHAICHTPDFPAATRNANPLQLGVVKGKPHRAAPMKDIQEVFQGRFRYCSIAAVQKCEESKENVRGRKLVYTEHWPRLRQETCLVVLAIGDSRKREIWCGLLVDELPSLVNKKAQAVCGRSLRARWDA